MKGQLTYIDICQVWNTPMSAFLNVRSIDPKPTTLGAWLEGCKRPNATQQKYADICQQLRQTENEAEQKALKLSLPAVMVGATVNTREKNDVNKIVSITGFTQVDIDMKDNKHLSDAADLRDAVARIAFVAFVGLSASGRGVWALVKVAEPQNIGAHFKQLCRDFESLRIVLDRSKGGNPTDLRIYSFDADAIIKERFAIYDRKYTPTPKPEPSQPIRRTPMPAASIFKGAETFAKRKAGAFTFAQGNRHHYIDNLCYYLNRHGIPQHEAEAYINAHLMPLSEIKSNCITHSYKSHANLFGTWKDVDTQPRISAPSPLTDKTDRTSALIAARPSFEPELPAAEVAPKQPQTGEKQAQNSHRDTITPQANIMPLLIDWAQLEQPEPWELNPF